MAIDLKKNRDSLLKVYNDIVSDSSKTDWVVFGYEGMTQVLKVVESGDGGIEEMSDELNSGKIQYAYCRVLDPNTALPKYVLINWQGEGAQDSFKLKCTAHLRDIQAFLKTVHVTLNARTEDDIDEDDIIKKVSKASGANYSFHKEKAKAQDAPAPVGTDYHRVIPSRDINNKSRDQFWAETEKDEQKRREGDMKKSQQEKEQSEKDRKERELREAKERDRKTEERIKAIRQQKDAELKANAVNKEAEKEHWEKQQQEVFKDDEEQRLRAGKLRHERAAEAANLTTGSASSARSFFKQKSVERPDSDARRAPPPPRKLKSSFSTEQQPQEPARREPIQLPKADPTPTPEPEPEPAYTPQSPTQPESPTSYEPEPTPAYEPEPESVYEIEPERELEAAPVSQPQTRNLLQSSLPARQDSDEEEEDQNWDEPAQEETSPPPAQQQQQEETQQQQKSPDTNGGSSDQGLCARALYDYQASDDTEINFDPDDIITNIDLIDEGWWQGFAPDGSYGMFPANYVELIQ